VSSLNSSLLTSSKEIIEKTGISRATLNNYIKLGILPRPLVKKPEDIRTRAKKIGYFPEAVTERILIVKKMKKEGYSMEDIVNRLHDFSTIDPAMEERGGLKEKDLLETTSQEPGRCAPETINSTEEGLLKLTINNLHCPDQRIPSLVSFSVLVADLQDSVRICADLPPEEYFELINQVWKCIEGSFKKYYGLYGKHTGDSMVYYFLKDKNSNYLMNSIYCALELREKVKNLGMEWKTRKGWFHDLYMNIGINEGQEYFGTIVHSPGIEFTALGDSVNCAGRLSDFARYGSIWITKNLINKLDIAERKKIRFGIRRKDHDHEMIVESMFSRVMDLLQDDNLRHSKFMDIAHLPVTEILDGCN
jgi:class 3 adenylate cyclase/DNA-binding transcriptional MerR regulator